ncbi:MAG TPA: 1-(5-phosphoribosyl)-5-[(5-phosphoribosylamino)methylideneamino] imidazole-4-carboxamide isomerase [Chitinophagaceae bacterium]|nr:1-(5-phosphoribosyl)-5-[(5-phosphoribosylamino)methylideneamino] imidazole-4-carboxamide isomerase [Chitinophagaceae bacterium]
MNTNPAILPAVNRDFIIPAIDLIAGKCVRLSQGDYSRQTIYNERPLEVARQFEDAGLRRLHLVDLDGARRGAVTNWNVLETLAARTSLVIDFGGGIKTEKDLRIVFDSGAALATIGSVAVKQEQEFLSWVRQFGAARFLIGADVRGEQLAVQGWQETTDRNIYDFIAGYLPHGLNQVFCTDVNRDGLLQGPALDLYREILARFPDLFFIASGGVSSVKDLEDLRQIGCRAVIVGKAIYENRISLPELTRFVV